MENLVENIFGIFQIRTGKSSSPMDHYTPQHLYQVIRLSLGAHIFPVNRSDTVKLK